MNYTFHVAASAIRSARFGRGDGPIWLDEVGCTINDTSLVLCEHLEVGRHNCDHDEDVGVICVFGKYCVHVHR